MKLLIKMLVGSMCAAYTICTLVFKTFEPSYLSTFILGTLASVTILKETYNEVYKEN